MGSEKTTIGLLGCGLWGRNILRDLRALGADVVVVDSSADARQAAVAAGAGAAVARLVDMPAVAGIVVATPATSHAAVISEALGRGVPVFAEKPLTTDVASAVRLAELAPRRLFVMHVWRYHPGVELLAAIARAEEFGPVHMLRTVRTNGTSLRRDVDAVWTLAPHDLSIAVAILGEIPPPRFACVERLGSKAVGMIGILGHEPCVVLEVSTRYADKRREVRLHCRDGVAVLVDDASDHIAIFRGSAETSPAEKRWFTPEPPLRRELEAFLGHLHGGPPPRSSAAEGREVVTALAELRRLAGLADAEES